MDVALGRVGFRLARFSSERIVPKCAVSRALAGQAAHCYMNSPKQGKAYHASQANSIQ